MTSENYLFFSQTVFWCVCQNKNLKNIKCYLRSWNELIWWIGWLRIIHLDRKKILPVSTILIWNSCYWTVHSDSNWRTCSIVSRNYHLLWEKNHIISTVWLRTRSLFVFLQMQGIFSVYLKNTLMHKLKQRMVREYFCFTPFGVLCQIPMTSILFLLLFKWYPIPLFKIIMRIIQYVKNP